MSPTSLGGGMNILPVSATYGKGYVGNISEEDRNDLSGSLQGLSGGITSVGGIGGNASVGSGWVLTGEVVASLGISKVGGVRYAKKILNIYND